MGGVVDRQYLVAGQGEDIARTLFQQRTNEYSAAGDLSHAGGFPWSDGAGSIAARSF